MIKNEILHPVGWKTLQTCTPLYPLDSVADIVNRVPLANLEHAAQHQQVVRDGGINGWALGVTNAFRLKKSVAPQPAHVCV